MPTSTQSASATLDDDRYSDDAGDDDDRIFVCLETRDDGSPCNARFTTHQKLMAHIAATKSGSHSSAPLYASLCLSNECVACGEVYSTTIGARQHLKRSLRAGGCKGSGCGFKIKADPYPDRPCPMCGARLADFKYPRQHLALHLPWEMRDSIRFGDDEEVELD